MKLTEGAYLYNTKPLSFALIVKANQKMKLFDIWRGRIKLLLP